MTVAFRWPAEVLQRSGPVWQGQFKIQLRCLGWQPDSCRAMQIIEGYAQFAGV